MSNTDFKMLDAAATSSALPFRGLVDALDRGFARGCVVPVRHHHHMERTGEPEATLLLMPAWSHPGEESQYLGVKLVTVVPGNTASGIPGLTSTYMLYDGVTGRQLAMMDGNAITGRRTVATSALAARYLSREDSRSLLVVGSGRVASLIPDAYLAVRPIERVTVWDIHPDGAARMVADLKARGLNAEVATDLETAVREADIVSAATLATEPLLRGSWLRPGVHVDLIGGFTPKMREADDAAVQAARVYVDTPEALIEAGDLVQPIRAGIVGEDHVVANLAQLARGEAEGRRSPDEITYFKAVGSGLADLVAATMVFETVTDTSR